MKQTRITLKDVVEKLDSLHETLPSKDTMEGIQRQIQTITSSQEQLLEQHQKFQDQLFHPKEGIITIATKDIALLKNWKTGMTTAFTIIAGGIITVLVKVLFPGHN